jgi:hypothetical protein
MAVFLSEFGFAEKRYLRMNVEITLIVQKYLRLKNTNTGYSGGGYDFCNW